MANPERAWAFFKGPFRGHKYCMAPMVDQSELPFRMLARSYQPDIVCWTPMLHSKNFSSDPKYRKDHFTTCEGDRPLIAQFCGNEPETVVAAAKYIEDIVDAVDLNLGCPQGIARKGRYGAFLMKEPDVVEKIVRAMVQQLKCPVTVKIRILDTIENTVKFAKMLESCGIVLLTVHGRTIDMKPNKLHRANWDYLKAVKSALTIPVVANGGIQRYEDIEECLKFTGCDAVMSAESLLLNPALFAGEGGEKISSISPKSWDMARSYLDYAKKYPVNFRMVRSHLFDMFVNDFKLHPDMRDALGRSGNIDDCEKMIDILSHRMINNIVCPVPIVVKEKKPKQQQQQQQGDNNNYNSVVNNNNNNNNVVDDDDSHKDKKIKLSIDEDNNNNKE